MRLNNRLNHYFLKVWINAENYLKERNFSACLAAVYCFSSLLSKSSDKKLASFSSLVGHYPFLLNIKYLRNVLNRWAYIDEGVYDVTLENSIVIKPYLDENEKGVILISFERELKKLCSVSLLRAIEERYYIVFIPSWSGLFSPALFSLSVMSSQTFFVMPVHKAEHQYTKYLGRQCVALNYNAASWVKKEFFNDYFGERDIDCLIVANFSKFKRHWLLFDALSMVPKHITAYCVGVPWGGRGKDEIQAEAELFGVGDRVIVVESPQQGELRQFFQRAKYFCALSFREGSFIAVAESLISGTPVIMFKNAIIGTKALLHEENSVFVSSASDLAAIFSRKEYIFDNKKIKDESQRTFSSDISCSKLNGDLRHHIEQRQSNKWTKDIYEFYSVRLSFFYSDESCDFRQELRHLDFGCFQVTLS